jgi:hypothetical protein
MYFQYVILCRLTISCTDQGRGHPLIVSQLGYSDVFLEQPYNGQTTAIETMLSGCSSIFLSYCVPLLLTLLLSINEPRLF